MHGALLGYRLLNNRRTRSCEQVCQSSAEQRHALWRNPSALQPQDGVQRAVSMQHLKCQLGVCLSRKLQGRLREKHVSL